MRSSSTTGNRSIAILAFLIELEKRGLDSRMGSQIDEAPYRRALRQMKREGKLPTR